MIRSVFITENTKKCKYLMMVSRNRYCYDIYIRLPFFRGIMISPVIMFIGWHVQCSMQQHQWTACYNNVVLCFIESGQ